MAQSPIVPPRPARSSDKDSTSGLMPKVPPRPINRHINRSVSPGRDRFAQSPLMQGIPCGPSDKETSKQYTQKQHSDDPVERACSVDMPSVGEEDAGLMLHAPKPSLPAASAKQQVMAVTRTDSDRAASFGIGQASNSEERTVSRSSNRKRPESAYSTYSDLGNHTDEEHGIPEIGQRVPMNKHLGDVQAPSPGPGSDASKRHHSRKPSSRSLPPGSYGLHGHGVAPQDKLDKAYYQKHPEALQRDQHTPHHDRQNNYAMSSTDLNKLVRDTAGRHAATSSTEIRGTPTDDVAFEASEKYASRISASRPMSVEPNVEATQQQANEDKCIHVDDDKNPEFYHYGETKDNEDTEDYHAPILASDEVNKDPSPHVHHPAIRPHLERRGSSFDAEDSSSRPTSRPRAQRHHSNQKEVKHTPLEDVEEYDPLFPEDGKEANVKIHEPVEEHYERHHFPSKDVWEDAPNSVHYTAEVSTPEVSEPEPRRPSTHHADRPITPAQAFALYQEELAEKDAKSRTSSFLPLQDPKPTWVSRQPHLQSERPASSSNSKRFPSRDIWEDTPESHIHEAEISSSPVEQAKPEIPARPAKKPSLSPERSTARRDSAEDGARMRPPVSDKPKPSIQTRSSNNSPGEANEGLQTKPKPPVPNRPVGGKIAVLQAGFMNDLNKRLQLGPQAVKKDDSPKDEESAEGKEKTPLSDARKSRARGPQRRAPVKGPVAAAPSEHASTAQILSFAMPKTIWSVDPELGDLRFSSHDEQTAKEDVDSHEPCSDLKPAASHVLGGETSSLEEAVSGEATPLTSKPAVRPQELTSSPAGQEGVVSDAEPHRKEELSLVSNTAGESILEATVQENDERVEPVEIHEHVKA
ncbi:uncharacterized protein UV8b_05654 [Ustilaginoidea virens]|uniref:Altered inheritance of mitochondria protein 21 n=1 Tax=Ustilaginoidea virens TaxID=1159556 RepID=A0A8E5MJ38_USTVR|nr:uncharacterized protein UV8b_05654 [Ustilaginoidea virens]QUC21411.1 hypothetical protein UV8b_05654 [Ustilaginoidea virens]